jgi:hypothetical protein
MKDWVIPFLMSFRPEAVSKELFEGELQRPVFTWRRIANLLMHFFDSDSMVELLGSVLVDLPKSDFDKIVAAYPIFVLARSAGFCQRIHTRGDTSLVVFVESDLRPMNWCERRGCVAHELAHVVKGHLSLPFSLDDPWKEKQQSEADALCHEWGLSEEITAVRKYLERRN